MGIVFINYRRDQTAGEARALYNDLVKRLGSERVFMDVDDIALGRDFREVLRQRLDDCEVMLALIGRQWSDASDASGRRRLDQADDFVRIEIATALQRNVAVTPVLLQDARMPAADSLPEDLKGLAFRNGFEISHQTWDSNVNELVQRLGLVPAPPPARPRARLPLVAGVLALLVAGAAAGYFVMRPQPAAPVPVVDVATIDRLISDLARGDADVQKAAIDRLRGELTRSPDAVRLAVAQLEGDSFFAMKSFRSRSELLGFLLAADAAAWTPDNRAKAQFAIRRLKENVAAGRARITPEMTELLDRLSARIAG